MPSTTIKNSLFLGSVLARNGLSHIPIAFVLVLLTFLVGLFVMFRFLDFRILLELQALHLLVMELGLDPHQAFKFFPILLRFFGFSLNSGISVFLLAGSCFIRLEIGNLLGVLGFFSLICAVLGSIISCPLTALLSPPAALCFNIELMIFIVKFVCIICFFILALASSCPFPVLINPLLIAQGFFPLRQFGPFCGGLGCSPGLIRVSVPGHENILNGHAPHFQSLLEFYLCCAFHGARNRRSAKVCR